MSSDYFDKRYIQNLDELYETARERNALRERVRRLEGVIEALSAPYPTVVKRAVSVHNGADLSDDDTRMRHALRAAVSAAYQTP